MVLLKRLLLPGKGAVISCILILLNVLCGEPVFLVKTSSFLGIRKVSLLSPFSCSYFPPDAYSYYGAVIATLTFINFQIATVNGKYNIYPCFISQYNPLYMQGISV